ncbi:hypothetical protein ACFQLX_24095 [Streptomyces polyrhachis]|uniref:Uncharacterized protein n=1 Tax=Streptomyces polyrhachis TaxID=1282885 RepID=A0ABW2GQ67_9ACTN
MTGATAGHSAKTYRAEVAITWLIVGIPLVYGVYNAVKAALQLFTH